MVVVFLRHGSVAALLLGVVAEIIAWLCGVMVLQPVMVLLGAMMFYLSEYGMHRFAFHAAPLPWPPPRQLQHPLHDHHPLEPGPLVLPFPRLPSLAPPPSPSP